MKYDIRTKTVLISLCLIALIMISVAGCTDQVQQAGSSSNPAAATSSTHVAKVASPKVTKASTSPTDAPTIKPTLQPTPTPTPKPPATPTPTSTPNPTATPSPSSAAGPFVGSKNSDVYHYPSCYHVNAIKPQNLVSFPTAAAAQAAGYRPCKDCHPPT